ncbi:MAG: tRNA (adenosine(37)-N6)-dimethylallyltransferase MiaA [Alphaproteobacteria bacterium 16-39-46]|nr:MAG: tRNA (adenosine(37)-N6)-dimethylallyltransferase MiaA [Alphaproteobacteria bacterium 16-39-46]OZA42349.1 MAG: tRNA (adenosine(37)-N6)-dimethylallyltransferase MiaA [Alphaproteobacteria bacterium 17-39-52]HQS84513.1 tRNA (adenosine(37)-N6)-dimethylallyltransferase MiaA [Alphaproteobacteria bacterium]HQS94299.1 tRNA (adenosine(37)-N6)-dimethylallyltransferase MiaA [Alphaproteobacteria bacterium]
MEPIKALLKTLSPLPKNTVFVIAGPTASGKSQFALDLATSLGGIIINGDSLQLYRELPILTAHPGALDLKKIPHKLYGTLDLETRTTAPLWAELAHAEIQKAQKKGKIPIIVGGTGFYLKVLMEGLNDIPKIPPEIREKGRLLLQEKGLSFLWEDLKTKDPESLLSLSPNDTQRLLRAWEIYEFTKTPLSLWQKKDVLPETQKNLSFFKILLKPPRDKLCNAIEHRTAGMIENGALTEVKNILTQDLPAFHPLRKAVGVTELQAYLEGDLSLEEALLKMSIKTRQYAKRQTTWFAHQFNPDFIYPFLYDGTNKIF